MAGGAGSTHDAALVHEDAILIDRQGVTVLLPVTQVLPEPVDGVPYPDRAIAGGVTAQNVTLGIGGLGMGTDDFRAFLGTLHGHYCYFEIEPGCVRRSKTCTSWRGSRPSWRVHEAKTSSAGSMSAQKRTFIAHRWIAAPGRKRAFDAGVPHGGEHR